MDAIDCFGSFATASLRLLNETIFLSVGVTGCYFSPPHRRVRQSLAECTERPRESECCVSRCSLELVFAGG